MDSIKSLLYNLKSNTSIIEKYGFNKDVLDEIRNDCISMLDLCKLFLISNRDSYYGYFVMNMTYEIDFTMDSIAGIKLNSYPPIFITNPLLLSQFNLKEILFIMCHEIDHIVLNHPTEMVKINPTRDENTFKEFNLAADASVNDRIENEILVEKRKYLKVVDGIIDSKALGKLYNIKKINKLESYLYYFNLIHEKIDEIDIPIPMPSNKNDGEKSNMEEDLEGANNTDDINDSNDNNSDINNYSNDKDSNNNDSNYQIITKDNYNNSDDHNWDAGTSSEEINDNVKEFLNAVFDSMNAETRGLMPGHFISSINKINEPAKISWQSLLKKYIGTISANKKHTRTRLNRRQPERFDISGRIDDKILKIVVAVDTSGSMYDDLLIKVFNEIFAIISKRKHDITVIECDTMVRKVYKVLKLSDVNMNVEGRGGTSFQPVIDYINDNKYFRDSLLIYFTDGFGEATITKPKTYRNLWVITGNKNNLSLKEPYGNVIDFEV